jgi:hypothetical protein
MATHYDATAGWTSHAVLGPTSATLAERARLSPPIPSAHPADANYQRFQRQWQAATIAIDNPPLKAGDILTLCGEDDDLDTETLMAVSFPLQHRHCPSCQTRSQVRAQESDTLD